MVPIRSALESLLRHIRSLMIYDGAYGARAMYTRGSMESQNLHTIGMPMPSA